MTSPVKKILPLALWQFFKEFEHLQSVDKDIIVAREYILGMGTVLFEPFQEEDLLQGQVEEGVSVVPLQEIFVKFRLMTQDSL